MDIRSYNDQLYGTIDITSVTMTQLDGNPLSPANPPVPDGIFLDLEVVAERYHNLDVTKQLVDGHSFLSATNELELHWEYTPGAESYDVEWLFYDIPSGQTITTETYDFKNATRINTSKQYYKISMAYPEGYLIYRIRPVGMGTVNGAWNNRIEGAWSFGAASGSLSVITGGQNIYQYAGLATDKNWTYQVAYAEDGKRKEVVSYFDGTFRERQSSTIINSDNTAVVSETVYDHEGRPAVSILPFPVENKGPVFYSTVNNSPLTGSFSKNNFDVEPRLDEDYPEPGAAVPAYTGPVAMGSSVEANNYYSSLNPNATDPYVEYIPDAENFAFQQTVYTNDGTNRVKTEGGVGAQHTVHKDKHSTKYMYANTNQVELDRLFGNEAGKAVHYSKVYVQDANGQMTVQYLDALQRVIATALTGEVPSNLIPLDEKPSPPPTIKVDVLKNNNTLENNRTYSSYTFVQPKDFPVTYSFEYKLEGAEHCDECPPELSKMR